MKINRVGVDLAKNVRQLTDPECLFGAPKIREYHRCYHTELGQSL